MQSSNADKFTVLGCHDRNLNTDRKRRLFNFFKGTEVLKEGIYCQRHIKISAGSILDISKYRDTCELSISILGGIAILRYIEYRMNQ